jgi:hypothetical protein
VFVVPRDGTVNLVERIEEAHDLLQRLDWRLHDLVVAVASEIDEDTASLERESQSDED